MQIGRHRKRIREREREREERERDSGAKGGGRQTYRDVTKRQKRNDI